MPDLTDDPTRQHVWKTDHGDVDIFALSEGFHNGPQCVECDEFFCHHCNPDCYREVCPARTLGHKNELNGDTNGLG